MSPPCTQASSIFRPRERSPPQGPVSTVRRYGSGCSLQLQSPSSPPQPLLHHRSKNQVLLQQPAERRKRRRRKRLRSGQSRSFLVYKPSFCRGKDKTMQVELSPQAKPACSPRESPGKADAVSQHSSASRLLQWEVQGDPCPAPADLPSSACPRPCFLPHQVKAGGEEGRGEIGCWE